MAYPLFHPSSSVAVPLFMSLAEFRAEFPFESEFIERKTGFNRTAAQEAAVAFSNADGGVILIGVDDAGTLVGRELSPGLIDEIHRAIREARDPGRYALAGWSSSDTAGVEGTDPSARNGRRPPAHECAGPRTHRSGPSRSAQASR